MEDWAGRLEKRSNVVFLEDLRVPELGDRITYGMCARQCLIVTILWDEQYCRGNIKRTIPAHKSTHSNPTLS
jgi:hypothetical protein